MITERGTSSAINGKLEDVCRNCGEKLETMPDGGRKLKAHQSHPEVPNKIKQYYQDGYMIVVFTNQSKKWKCEQIQLVMKELDIPLFVVIATDKSEYKPNPILLNVLCQDTINKEESFFVGDALGRKTDFSDSDKVFAETIGIKYYSPEEIFRNKIE